MEKLILSKLENNNFSKAVNEIYLLTDYNCKQYQNYYKWFYTKGIPRIFDNKGEIYFYLDGFIVVGLTILKKTKLERKICTLLINEEYRKKGYCKELLETSFNYLETDKPLITIPEKRIKDFQNIITSYNWQETEISDLYISREIIFNSKQLKKTKRKDL